MTDDGKQAGYVVVDAQGHVQPATAAESEMIRAALASSPGPVAGVAVAPIGSYSWLGMSLTPCGNFVTEIPA